MKLKLRIGLVGLAVCMCMHAGYGQTIYSQSITNIDGGQVSLSSYQGHKILFMIAPCKLSDSAKVDEIAAFAAKYPDSAKLVGIMSIEDGYVDSNKAEIKSMYQSRGINIVLTQGMHTKKVAGANQGAIMHWLSDSALNKRFFEDAAGVGQLFFVNEVGKLYAVLVAQTPLISAPVERCLRRKI